MAEGKDAGQSNFHPDYVSNYDDVIGCRKGKVVYNVIHEDGK